METYIPNFNQWLNEASLAHTIEMYRLDNMKWSLDQGANDQLNKDHDDIEDSKVYVAIDKERGRKYTFKTWRFNTEYNIEVLEDKVIIFSQAYEPNDKRYYNLDCENIIGFRVKK
jgi:hypothetical protein